MKFCMCYVFCAIFTLTEALTDQSDSCLQRDYGHGSIVCVCNTQYCDVVPSVEQVDSSTYLRFTSNKEGLRFRKKTDLLRVYDGSDIQNAIFVIPEIEFQEILGWGGAFSDASGINSLFLKSDLREKLMRSYFGNDSIEYNLCRVPIAATDFSMHPYTYCDTEDHTLESFSLAPEDFVLKIPFILKALELAGNDLQLFASPWIAPKWMKTNKSYSGQGSIIEELYPLWAKYLQKFLDEYQKFGIKMWGLTTGNEPSLANMPDQVQKTPTVAWSSMQMQTFLRDHLGPLLRSSNQSDIKIMALDDQRGYLPDLDALFNDSLVNSYVDGIAVHWYQDWYRSPDMLSKTHYAHPDKFLLATEACTGGGLVEILNQTHVMLGSWDRAETFASDILQDMNNWVTGWVSWNMVLNLQGGPTYISNFVDAPIIVNSTANEFYKQPMYYAHGHFSKFVPRGSKKIFISQLANSSVTCTGFKRPDSGIVVVALNRLNAPIKINIIERTRQIHEILTPNSITTFIYWNN